MSIFSFFRIQNGFSMIELVIVFSLLSVVTGIGFFSFIDFSRVQEVDQGAKDIASFYEKARANTSSFIKPSVCGDDTLRGYRVDYCANATCQGQGAYEMRVLCGQQEHVVDSLNLTENIIHDDASSCTSVTYRLPQGAVEGTLPCSQIIDRSGERETVTVDRSGHVVVGEEGRVAVESTPTPTPTPVNEGSGGTIPRGDDESGGSGGTSSLPNPCSSTETFLAWDVGSTNDVVMCEDDGVSRLRSTLSSGLCASTQETIVWSSNTAGDVIRVCINNTTRVAELSTSGSCPTNYNLRTWRAGTGTDTQVQACANPDQRIIRMIWAPRQVTGERR